MKLIVVAGTGTGASEHAAYEAALSKAEMSDHELPGASSVHFSARSLMLQSQPGRWAHAALGWLHDSCIVPERVIALQDENLERLQRRLRAAAQDLGGSGDLSPSALRSRFASIVCRGDPVCALIVASCGEGLAPLPHRDCTPR